MDYLNDSNSFDLQKSFRMISDHTYINATLYIMDKKVLKEKDKMQNYLY